MQHASLLSNCVDLWWLTVQSYYYCFSTPTVLLLSTNHTSWQFYILRHNYCCLYSRLLICHCSLLLFVVAYWHNFELMTFFELCSSILQLYSLSSTIVLPMMKLSNSIHYFRIWADDPKLMSNLASLLAASIVPSYLFLMPWCSKFLIKWC
jgi:hypothetical protein